MSQPYDSQSGAPYPPPQPAGYPPPPQPANPGYAQPGYGQPNPVQPGYGPPNPVPPGYAQPGPAQPGYAQPGPARPGWGQPGYTQAGYPPVPPTPPKKSRVGLILAIVIPALVLVVGGVAAVAFLAFQGDKVYVQADVDAALLAVDDLPSGYAKEPVTGEDGEATELTPCLVDTAPMDLSGGDTGREFVASHGDDGPYVFHGVGLIAEGQTLQPMRDVFTSCTSWTEDGVNYAVAPANFGSYGDETHSFSLRMTDDSAFIDLTTYITMMRKGNLVSVVMVAAFPRLDADEVTEIVELAAAKLPT